MSFSRYRSFQFRSNPHLFGSKTTGEQDDLAAMELSGNHSHNYHLHSEEPFAGSHVFDSPKRTKTTKQCVVSTVPDAAAVPMTAAANNRQAKFHTASNQIDADNTASSSVPSNATTATAAKRTDTAIATVGATKKPTFRPVKLSKAKSSKAAATTALKEMAPTRDVAAAPAVASNPGRRPATTLSSGEHAGKKNMRLPKKSSKKPKSNQSHNTSNATTKDNKKKSKTNLSETKEPKQGSSHAHDTSTTLDRPDQVESYAALADRPQLHFSSRNDVSSNTMSHHSRNQDLLSTDDLHWRDRPSAAQQHVGDNTCAHSCTPNGRKRRLDVQEDIGSRGMPAASNNARHGSKVVSNKRPHFATDEARTNNNQISKRPTNEHTFRRPHATHFFQTHHRPEHGRGTDSRIRNDTRGRFHDGERKQHSAADRRHHPSSFHERGVRNAAAPIFNNPADAIRKDAVAEANAQTEKEKELLIKAEARTKAAEERAEELCKELEMSRLVTSKLNENFQAKINAMEEEKCKLEEARCNAEAEARAKAVEADDKDKEVKTLSAKVKELTSEVDAVKKAQERMRIRLQKDAERKVAIEANALADVTHKLHEEQDARAEALKIAIARSEEVKQKADEVEAMKQQLEVQKAETESTKSAALVGLLRMQEDNRQRAETDALKIQELANAFQQEQEARLAAAAEVIAKSAEAEKSAEEAATLRREIEMLRAEAARTAKEDKPKHQDGETAQTAFIIDECLDGVVPNGKAFAIKGRKAGKEPSLENATQEPRGSKRADPNPSNRPSFKPKKGKKCGKANTKPQEEKESCSDGQDCRFSTERRYVFSDLKGNTDATTAASAPDENGLPNVAARSNSSQTKQNNKKSQFNAWQENSDEAFQEQERLLNASKARMRSQHATQARVLPGHEKSKAAPVPNRSFAALIQDVHVKYPEHWQYKNLYARLGLPRSASDAMIKSQYRRLALQYHPDRNSHSEESKNKFQAVTEAYEALMHKH